MPPIRDDSGCIVSPVKTAIIYNDRFRNVLTNKVPQNDFLEENDINILFPSDDITRSVQGVVKAIKRLPLNSSPGPDGHKIIKDDFRNIGILIIINLCSH